MTAPAHQANRLIHETSPYLLQHAHNPVDWYPWGPEAFARARAEDRPVLLSVGYSACHWCHVMAHESFEDPETARLMNNKFVNIKVDREERPDVDAIYMDAVQAMTGRGGWPMTVFLTPDGRPFYGGTYYPPAPRYGMPSFRQLLAAIAEAWRERRSDLEAHGEQLVDALARSANIRAGDTELGPAILEQAAQTLLRDLDRSEGGFSAAPKFPQPMTLDFLLQHYLATGDETLLHAVVFTLEKMARGGMYDQLGGGFHRYSTDAKWLVPHFEKMLYDNAQLARTYLHAWQVTGKDEFRRVVEGTLDYALREMASPEGGFDSAQDADSEGEEGKYFLWTPDEMTDLLGTDDAPLFMAYYGVTAAGNFREADRGERDEGKSILHVSGDLDAVARSQRVSVERLQEAVTRGRTVLLAARSRRVPPGRDEKILSEWNGLMLAALAEAGAVLSREDYLTAARQAAAFLLERMAATANDGGLRFYRSYKDGRARLPGYLEDYAAVGLGFLALYEATLDLRHLKTAAAIPAILLHLFFDPETGGLFQISAEHEELVVRRKDFMDNAVPSGNSLAAELLVRLGRLQDRADYATHAANIMQGVADALGGHPAAFGRLLCALDFMLNPGHETAVIGDPAAADTAALVAEVRRRYLPTSVLALRAPGDEAAPALVPFLADRGQVNGRATAYVCRDYVCNLPVTEPGALGEQLRRAAQAK